MTPQPLATMSLMPQKKKKKGGKSVKSRVLPAIKKITMPIKTPS